MNTIVPAIGEFYVTWASSDDKGKLTLEQAVSVVAWVIEDFTPKGKPASAKRYHDPWPICIDTMWEDQQHAAIVQPNGLVVDTNRGIYISVKDWFEAIQR